MENPTRIHAIDSHTGGEPTRVVTTNLCDTVGDSISEMLEGFRKDRDHLRRAIVCEPRGHDAVVGALLCDPASAGSTAGVIFFNNVGYLGMCGHGMIGLIKTLEYMGRIAAGIHKIDTAAGTVEAALNADGSVTITNVSSYRHAKDVKVDVPGYGPIAGDIAYGGNWFFLIGDHDQTIELVRLPQLTDFCRKVRATLIAQNITGANDAEIDHIELFGATPNADSRNFVLCPGLEYDRSPCGTGTSAKLACLYADGKLREGDVWRQESVTGSIFEGRVRLENGSVIPVITGTAHVTAEVELILDTEDPYRFGMDI